MKVYKFRVLLDSEAEDKIFRDILVHPDGNFESFYTEIIRSFRFKGNQMASFYMSDEEWNKGTEISLMDMGLTNEDGLPTVMHDAILKDFVQEDDQKIILVYDFLKMWCFLIELIETVSTDIQDLPQTVLEVGTAPDENKENNESKMLSGEELSFDFDDSDDGNFDQFDEDDFDDINDAEIEDENGFY